MSIVRRALALTAGVALSAALIVPGNGESAAASSIMDDFDPGMIITDDLFYDSNSMTAAQIQTFLEGKVKTCREDLSAGEHDPIVCLKDYSTTTSERSADDFCRGYEGGLVQTAAQIIDAVARSCGISQKTLLVTLQKEQGLVTHTWPSDFRYRKAMGYACPDDGSCKPEYAGFFNQVYTAAWQFKRYQALPTRYNYQAGRTNIIKHHPSDTDATKDCPTVDVYIENQATAGLYIYTPYVPNQAALDAGFGKGDVCSSYGNRNFYGYYTSWFGSTTRLPVTSPILETYNARGGQETLGGPISSAIEEVAHGGGWYQTFDFGTIYHSTATGTGAYFEAGTAMHEAYIAAGGPAGDFGWPTTELRCLDGLCAIEFQNMVLTQEGTDAVKVVSPEEWLHLSPWRRGTDTLAVRRGATYYFKNSLTGGEADVVAVYGRPADQVLVGDWDGDGIDTLAVRRGATYYFKNSLTGGEADAVVVYGRADDEVLVGDWNGDGVDTLAVRRGSTLYVKNSLAGGGADHTFTYGRVGDAVLVGDWNADGRDTFTIRRGRTYHIKNSLGSGAADHVVDYGRPDDVVLVGDWDGPRAG
ncbi:LGFP repeat-containing protein [Demequina pelophila]|uniref:LGFP repeat-containing protein n=1 Tax=Demequina pelophila TaxID=1638984 RepID=UPI000783910A|nr:hypothetical protein [Demequina pelophila]